MFSSRYPNERAVYHRIAYRQAWSKLAMSIRYIRFSCVAILLFVDLQLRVARYLRGIHMVVHPLLDPDQRRRV